MFSRLILRKSQVMTKIESYRARRIKVQYNLVFQELNEIGKIAE